MTDQVNGFDPRSLNDSFVAVTAYLDSLAEGNFSHPLPDSEIKEMQSISTALSTMSITLACLVKEVRELVNQVNQSACAVAESCIQSAFSTEQIVTAMMDLSGNAEKQLRLVQEAVSFVKEISEVIAMVGQNVEFATDLFGRVRDGLIEQKSKLGEEECLRLVSLVDECLSNVALEKSITHELLSGNDKIVEKIHEVHEITHSNAAGVEQVSAATEEQKSVNDEIAESSTSLARLAQRLAQRMTFFKLD
ncbi:MAG: methyl-accepting chemotaxis protein [Armatimonadetes bacterium]|nr:methyl-accepting chemotaxis protein [Armatimonadota bacterium]